jgi:hypothetical protein
MRILNLFGRGSGMEKFKVQEADPYLTLRPRDLYRNTIFTSQIRKEGATGINL